MAKHRANGYMNELEKQGVEARWEAKRLVESESLSKGLIQFIEEAAHVIARSEELQAEILQLNEALKELYTKQGEKFFRKDGTTMSSAQSNEMRYAHGFAKNAYYSLHYLSSSLLAVPKLDKELRILMHQAQMLDQQAQKELK